MIKDRIENKRFEKNINFFKWSAAITLILALAKISFNPNIFNVSGKASDFMISLIPIFLYIQYRNVSKKWRGQFIEWTENEISFKSRKHDNTSINLTEITSINIKLDIIEIETKRENYSINIEDYTKYEDRLRIKNNFEKIKEKLSLFHSLSQGSTL